VGGDGFSASSAQCGGAAERRRIVEETLLAGSSVARVAQRHGVNANQVFQWRRLYQSGLLGGTPEHVVKLLPVSVTEDAVPAKPEQVEAATSLPVVAAGSIHIELRKGVRVSLEGTVDPAQVQTVLEQQPLSGHVFVFRGRRGDIVKVLWFDGDGLCLLAKRLERGRFIWPQAMSGSVFLSRAQLSMLLEGIDWRAPIRTAQPQLCV